MHPKLSFALLHLIVAVISEHTVQKRIIGGVNCQLPYLTEIKCDVRAPKNKKPLKYTQFGGIFITKTWVLTSANAAQRCSELLNLSRDCKVVVVDDYEVDCEEIVIYSKFVSDVRYKHYYDIALISFRIKLPYIISLAALPQQRGFTDKCKSVTIAGLGQTQVGAERRGSREDLYKKLRCLNVTVIVRDECVKKSHKGTHEHHTHYSDEPIICTEVTSDEGVCRGDYGGPVICDDVVVGIISHQDEECAKVGHVLVSTRIEDYYSFIQNATGMTLPFQSSPADHFVDQEKDKKEKSGSGNHYRYLCHASLLISLLVLSLCR